MEDLDLPDFFIADVDDQSTITPNLIADAIETLIDNQRRYLLTRSTSSIAKALCSLAEDWLHPDYPFRRVVLQEGPDQSGFSQETLARGLDAFFETFTAEAFELWLSQEFGHLQRRDSFVADKFETRAEKRSRFFAHPVIAHFTPGTLPIPALQAMVCGLLVGSSQFLKLSARGSFIPRMFAHSIYQREPKLGACIELACWKGADSPLMPPLVNGVNLICAAGADETLDSIRGQMPARTSLVRYGTKVSFAYVEKSATSSLTLHRTLEGLADDITAWDQFGCLSPHVVYVQELGETTPERFAQKLAEALELREKREPRGTVSDRALSQIAFARKFYGIRAKAGPGVELFQSEANSAWTVIQDSEIRFQTSCGGRLIYVKSVETLEQALHGAEPIQPLVSTVGIAASEDSKPEIAETLARWGVNRICEVGSMQRPPLHWRHDGRPALGDLVRWVEWELS